MALTPAKSSLFVLCDSQRLSVDGLWRRLINDSKQRGFFKKNAGPDTFNAPRKIPGLPVGPPPSPVKRSRGGRVKAKAEVGKPHDEETGEGIASPVEESSVGSGEASRAPDEIPPPVDVEEPLVESEGNPLPQRSYLVEPRSCSRIPYGQFGLRLRWRCGEGCGRRRPTRIGTRKRWRKSTNPVATVPTKDTSSLTQ